MLAYDNADWAECYDLWVRLLFGDGPAEDIPIFTSILEELEAKQSDSNSHFDAQSHNCFSIVDIGTGSGRVLVNLQEAMGKIKARRLEVWGFDPGAPMLERAERFWREESQKRGTREEVKTHWVECGATDFAEYVTQESAEADLLIFAAGGIGHVTKDEDIEQFLKGVVQVLNKDGVAVVSVLRDFILDGESKAALEKGTDSTHQGETTAQGQLPQRIPSKDHPGLLYVKHPTTETVQDKIKTERFRLEVEDENGRVLRSHELSWDEKFFEREKWENMVQRVGLRVKEVREGAIQVWYCLVLSPDRQAEREREAVTPRKV